MPGKIDFARLGVRRLQANERISHFDCGDPDLNDFILHEAAPYQNSLLAVSYVLEERDHPESPLAFVSVANDKVALGDFANNTEFNRFRKKNGFPQSKRLRSYPAIKLCRLGVSAEYKSMHLGSFILDFMRGYFTADNKSGCRFMTVDAYIKAVPFYEKNGFKMLNPGEDNNPHTRLLFCDLKEIADHQRIE